MDLLRRLREDTALREVLVLFLSSRLLILLIGRLSPLVIAKGRWFNDFAGRLPVFDPFYRWDAGWYMLIAEGGYSYTPGEASSVQFFPLYPLLAKVLAPFAGGVLTAGYLTSNAALLLASIYLYRLVKEDFSPETAKKAVLFMLISPASFFFSIFYTEGLFLMLTVSSLYYARRGRWFVSSALGFLLSLTRPVGVLISVPLAIEYLGLKLTGRGFEARGKVGADALNILLVPLGLLSYMGYLHLRFKDALAFVHTRAAWGMQFTPVFTTLSNLRYTAFYNAVFLGSVAAAALLTAYMLKVKLRPSYVVYSCLLLFVYLSTGIMDAIIRYVSSIFPLYISLSLLAERNRILDVPLTLASAMFLALFTILFANGYWFP